jgi:hypothetical protein
MERGGGEGKGKRESQRDRTGKSEKSRNAGASGESERLGERDGQCTGWDSERQTQDSSTRMREPEDEWLYMIASVEIQMIQLSEGRFFVVDYWRSCK